ncbi:HNH endonuclease [Propionispora hippei]|uniref:HNH endonuclease n=1 Tax=Propionispora hippei DSM 15287 TaxID=1123003 RepID=A0A1M6DYV4_9FIRM|nr:HNH endonuclease [Propionispora hippei]SHI78371.1 HNH endonuclease [Propionispora hippei DSM 15287]
MPIILSQRVDTGSDYNDVPFVVYHFPKRYRRQINPGDLFLYYQGNRVKKEQRYYFGTGIIGRIELCEDGEHYNAWFLEAKQFTRRVPIYNPAGGYYESLDYTSIRKSETPPWQNSIRPVSESAFSAILAAAGLQRTDDRYGVIENAENPLQAIRLLNETYKECSPQKRDRMVSLHIERGTRITSSLKKLLGPFCQICGAEGFVKHNGDRYIEAHHLVQIALSASSSLCSDNVILVCPNCHRELHYGRDVEVADRGDEILISLGNVRERLIRKNTVEYLEDCLINNATVI